MLQDRRVWKGNRWTHRSLLHAFLLFFDTTAANRLHQKIVDLGDPPMQFFAPAKGGCFDYPLFPSLTS